MRQPPPTEPAPPVTGTLRLLATTDLHARLRGYNYPAGEEDVEVGLSRAASVIARLRASVQGGLLLDNGDFLTGDMLGDQAFDAARRDDPNPVIAAMNALRYDAAALGNHDFNPGLPALTAAMAQARFPILSSNVLTRLGRSPVEDSTLAVPWTMIERLAQDGRGVLRPLRIGVIGFTPPQIMQWDRHNLEGRVIVRGILEAAAAWIPAIRAAGADLVVALCHSGIAPADPAVPGSEDVGLAVARAGGIDALVLGHRHRVFPGRDYAAAEGVDPVAGTLAGVPTIMPGCWGRHVGRIDLALDWDGVRWRMTRSVSACHKIADRRADGAIRSLAHHNPDILRATDRAHRRSIRETARPVGSVDMPLTSYFAQLGRSRAIELVARAQRICVERLLRGTPDAKLPVIGIAAPVRCGGRGGPENYVDIPSGEVTLGQLLTLYPYTNRIAALKASGGLLREWLERSVSAFHRIAPGATNALLIDPRFPSFDLDLADRVGFEIDLSRPPRYGPQGQLLDARAWRVRDLRFLGKKVREDDIFVLALSEFRAQGGGGFPVGATRRLELHSSVEVHDAIRDLLGTGQAIRFEKQAFTFTPMPHTSVNLLTGPGSIAHLRDLAGLSIGAPEQLPTGFVRLRVDLASDALETADTGR
ncbi:2',3'-cyclic-nucleotide 2'-phosphodiesterase/3'-nucleotidase [Palleronia aestuarii]|uniref:2',3'-cyclic-nucleotide 2'-phosphodiesterase/3'-nucleotidase n=1 Tax=Palleronia aestuarii TaxID=568105 RepID=A0A2W7QBE4_9RHOB|nr:5'-nucleotidase C-terminal domain-containing protein [Palleronia aestuarii]PZX19069.1 2',3'-cyclic-nucleotide 2'-phosphodiesterase/3'-nucleotidase [Palleronia aestuarii]